MSRNRWRFEYTPFQQRNLESCFAAFHESDSHVYKRILTAQRTNEVSFFLLMKQLPVFLQPERTSYNKFWRFVWQQFFVLGAGFADPDLASTGNHAKATVPLLVFELFKCPLITCFFWRESTVAISICDIDMCFHAWCHSKDIIIGIIVSLRLILHLFRF